MSSLTAQGPLHDTHLALGAKLIPFGGTMMPLSYGAVKDEVLSVRASVGIFDVSHMGEFFVSGARSTEFIDFLLPNYFASLSRGKAVYSPLLNEQGGIVDDLIAYKLEDNQSLLCVNAANREKDWSHISSLAKKFDGEVSISDHSRETALFAIQGPKAIALLKEIFPKAPLSYKKFECQRIKGHESGSELIVAFTGYTGEDGAEVFVPREEAEYWWERFTAAGAMPAGLAARDVLRIEAAYPLYGNELDNEHTPFESGLGWTVKEGKNFFGREALGDFSSKAFRAKRVLIKLELADQTLKRIPRAQNKVFLDGREIGLVSSGTYSFTLDKTIALARVDNLEAELTHGTIEVEIRASKIKANQVKSFLRSGEK